MEKISIGTNIFCADCGIEMFHGMSPISNLCATCYSKRPVTKDSTDIDNTITYSHKPAFTSKRKTYISTPEAKLAAIRTAKDTAKSLGQVDYYNGLEAAHAILQDRPAVQMQPTPKWYWFKFNHGIIG